MTAPAAKAPLAARRAPFALVPRGLVTRGLVTRGLVPLGLVAALALSSCRAGAVDRSTVDELLAEQHYSEAYRVAAERVNSQPDDALALHDLERTRVAYWIDEGRRLALEGDVEQALDVFTALSEQGVAPETVSQWITKCRRMISEDRRLAAWQRELDGTYDEAAELYAAAVEMWPEDEFARAGAERIEMLAQWRREQRSEYYNSGIRDLRFLRMPEARRSFEAALKFAPNDAEAQSRIAEVRRMQAQERVRLAEQHEAAGLYHAAANEYRQAKELAPQMAGIDERIGAAEVEVAVLENLGAADRLVGRGETDKALALLAELESTTRLQGDVVREALVSARERSLEQRYERALELERDFDFERAIVAYDETIAAADGFYRDSIARRNTLASYITLATQLYAEYESAQSDSERISALRKIEILWPTYRDVSERLAELAPIQIER